MIQTDNIGGMEVGRDTGTPVDGQIAKRSVGFLIAPEFAPLGVFAAIEVLRAANRILNEPYYSWTTISQDGHPVITQSATEIIADAAIGDDLALDMLFICTGFRPESCCHSKTLGWIRNLSRHGTSMGAISTGTYVLARAGVIAGRRCSIHSDHATSLREEFPEVELVNGLYEIDRGLYTCTGGTSAIDLMITIVRDSHGEGFASAIAHQFQQDRVRKHDEDQSKIKRLGLRVKSEPLGLAIDIMEKNIETPQTLPEIADEVGVTQRQLQRLFRKHIGSTPKEIYLSLRLNYAQQLLLQTALPVVDVACAVGFSSASHFTKCYKARFGYSPIMERAQAL